MTPLPPIFLIVAASLGSPNSGAEPRPVSVLVLSADLSVWKGTLLSLDETAAVVSDESRRVVRCEAPGTLAVLAADPLAAAELGVGAVPADARRSPPDQATLARSMRAESAGVAVTGDGERFIGAPGAGAANHGADALAWTSERFGAVSIPLERLAWVAFPSEANAPARRSFPPGLAGADDAVLLRNGDSARGLVARIGGSVTLEPPPGEAGEARVFEGDRVAAVVLSNPPVESSGARVWLSDGTVFRPAPPDAGSARGAGAVRPVRAAIGGSTAVVPADVRAWAPELSRIVPLSLLSPAGFRPTEQRVYAPAPRVLAHADDLVTPGLWALDAGDISLSGPIEAEWTLDESAAGFVCSVVIENESDPWVGCAVVVTGPGGSAARVELSSGAPAGAVALRFAPQKNATLKVRVESGAFGGINDRVRLVRPLVIRRPG